MVMWVCYPTGDEPDMWTAWHRNQSDTVKGKHASALRFLVAGHWKKPHFELLQGKACAGLGEIRLKADLQWRLIGHHDPVAGRFTLVMICHHKDQVYVPRKALQTAAARWAEMQGGLQGVTLSVYPS